MYSEYAKYFDKIFPANDKIVQFLENHLYSNKILDIGCGSGEYAIALHGRGYSIAGIDLDSEMISYAKMKSSDIDFNIQNMLDMDDKKYDSIYCIGNILVHLPSKADIQKFIDDCYSKLGDGSLILQIINYDWIVEKHITSLPTIKNEGVEFTRNYTFEKDKIIFSTKLKIQDIVYENNVELIPLLKQELEEMLIKAGFMMVESYKGFSDAPYTRDSYALVIVACK